MPRGMWNLPGLVIEPVSPALEERNLNYWTAREVPYSLLFSEYMVSEARKDEQISLLYLKICVAKINKKGIKNTNLQELKKRKKEEISNKLKKFYSIYENRLISSKYKRLLQISVGVKNKQI